MVVAVLIIDLSIPQSDSLKDKRRVIKSIKDKIRNNFNVSVAEIGAQDFWKSAQLGIAVISQDATYANGVISKIQDMIENRTETIMTNCTLEWR